jgi:hypothetical protein
MTFKKREIFRMSTKRIILADGSRLLREMLHRVIDKAGQLEVVQEVPGHDDLPLAIKRFNPEWVIISLPYSPSAHGQIDTCMQDFPSVRFLFLSPESNHVKMKWQTSHEEDVTNLSLKNFIEILEKDLQHT